MASSRGTPSKSSRKASKVFPFIRYSQRYLIGTRVPTKHGTPPSLSGSMDTKRARSSDCSTSSVLKSRSWEAIVLIAPVSFMAHSPFLGSCWLLSKHKYTEPLTTNYRTAMAHSWVGRSSQRFQQRLSLLEVRGVKALREPAVDRGQERVGFGVLTLGLPQACEAHGRSQFKRPGLLTAGNVQGMSKARFHLHRVRTGQPEDELSLQTMQLRF